MKSVNSRKWLQLLTSELSAQFPVSSQYLEPLDLVVVSPGLNNKLYNGNNVLTENSSDSRLVSTGMISATTGTIHISKLILRSPPGDSQDEKKVDDNVGSWSHAGVYIMFLLISNCTHCLALTTEPILCYRGSLALLDNYEIIDYEIKKKLDVSY